MKKNVVLCALIILLLSVLTFVGQLYFPYISNMILIAVLREGRETEPPGEEGAYLHPQSHRRKRGRDHSLPFRKDEGEGERA